MEDADLKVVLPDLVRASSVIHRGFSILGEMAARGGLKVVRSVRYLERLMRIVVRKNQKVSYFPR